MGFTEEYGRLKKITEDGLAALLPENIPDKLRKSMAYSLTDGGKRLRPRHVSCRVRGIRPGL